MNLFNFFRKSPKLEEKSVLPFYASAMFSSGSLNPNWNGADYNTLCQEGYQKNPIVYGCVRMTSDGAAKIPLRVYVSGKYDASHPLQKLLNHPNPWQSGALLKSYLFGYLQISGNSYLHIVTTKDRRKPNEIYVARPDKIQIMLDKMGYIQGFAYKAEFQKEPTIIEADYMLHLKYFSPLDEYYGQSPLMAAMRANDVHNRAADFQKSLLDNSARPSGCLVYKGNPQQPNLTAEQFSRIKNELLEQYTGTQRAGKPMLLEGGLEWQSISLSPADMEFSQLHHNSAREIALAFGVPPMLLGIQGDSTYSNYQEAQRAFTRNTLIPMSELLSEGLSRHFSKIYAEDIEVKPDIENLPAFLPEKEARRNFIAGASFLSDKEKYDMLF